MSTALQHGLTKREPRVAVLLPARMRLGATWVDAVIHNVSSRGLLVASDDAPESGSYVEIRRGSNITIGRAIWRKGRFFGVRSQDTIDLTALQMQPQRPGSASQRNNSSIVAERRSAERLSGDAAIARKLERNRDLARLLQFAVIGLFVVAACVGIAAAVYEALKAPASRIANAMSVQP